MQATGESGKDCDLGGRLAPVEEQVALVAAEAVLQNDGMVEHLAFEERALGVGGVGPSLPPASETKTVVTAGPHPHGG